ncbi:MAG TPA: nucleotide exchange factor GrpE, partial [Candidatus Melainabacteria bacterium]|nr:nucleotide exchange factor GrpE [Candidatus Melainabacteria bacterium]
MTDEDKGNEPNSENKDQEPSRDNKNAMKAFYRAMYAGADPDPDDYGIKVEKEGESARDSVSSAELNRMQQELQEMERRCQEAENLYKRMAADFENYRKRMQKEKEEFAAVGIQRAIEAILPALDDMDLAVSNLNADMEPKSIIESLNMVYKRFARCLEQIGITQLDVIGEQFDPRLHEPVQQVVDANVPEGSIVFQLRPGYQFNDKILRPSLVNVATGGSDPDSEEVEE